MQCGPGSAKTMSQKSSYPPGPVRVDHLAGHRSANNSIFQVDFRKAYLDPWQFFYPLTYDVDVNVCMCVASNMSG